MADHWSNVSQSLHRTHWSHHWTDVSILWLRSRGQISERAIGLQKTIKAQGFKLTVVDVFDVDPRQIADSDLILLDGFERLDGLIETVLTRIRLEHRVPLVILTNGHSTEQLVTALTAGADAIWAVNISFDVLLARCKAILRRSQTPGRHC